MPIKKCLQWEKTGQNINFYQVGIVGYCQVWADGVANVSSRK